LAVEERKKVENHSNKGIFWNLLSKMCLNLCIGYLILYLFFIDQQEDSLLSSSDEASIFILGSKNSVSFKPEDLTSLKYYVAFLYPAFLRSSKAGHSHRFG